MDRIFNRKEEDLHVKRMASSDGAPAAPTEDDKSAENILHRLQTLRSSSKPGPEDAAQEFAENLAYQRYKMQSKKKGMDDDEAEEKSKAIIEKLKGVLKNNVENKLTTASQPGEQTPSTLAALQRLKP